MLYIQSKSSIALLKVGVISSVLALGACGESTPKRSFKADVQPILQQRCLECHKAGGSGEKASGLNMETYAALMKGTKFGPIIKPGDSVSSTLVRLIDGKADPSISMPHGKEPLTSEQINTIKQWIEQGAQDN